MTTVVVISDNEDADDDCVIDSVITLVDDESESNLYQEVCKENQLLADFIKECLKLENSIGMQQTLVGKLLKHYYAADKTARESPRIQKNLRRANYLIKTDPGHRFSHIKDLCNILQAAKIKKRVPFVTLTTNMEDKCRPNEIKRLNSEPLDDNKCRPNEIQRLNSEPLDVINGTCKKAKLYTDNFSPFSESNGISFDDTCDAMDQSVGMETCSQQSSEEGKLLIPKKVTFIVPTATEKKLQVIEKKIDFYKQKIAVLEEQEVDDDSVNSAYIKCERLKIKVVSLYKERCQLIGNQPVKHKGIRLKLPEGRPPGPTKALERFLNKNCNKDGDPPFPDFCDVVTCVTEANDKDDLGWTKAQIMNEASTVFTLCGRALQKRRQNREYRDLLNKVKKEEIERDPADDDPELLAKLEANKRIAVKKESDILERYTMLQYAAPKSKSQPNITTTATSGDDKTDQIDAPAEEISSDNHDTDSILSNVDDSEEINDSSIQKANEILNADKNKTLSASHSDINDSSKDCIYKDPDNDKMSPLHALEYCSDDKGDNCNKTKRNVVISNGAGHVNKAIRKDDNNICNNNNDLEANKLNIGKNQILHANSIVNQVNHKLDEDAMGMFKRLGDNFTLTVEIMSDSC